MVDEGFLKKENRDMILVASRIDILCEKMEKYIAPRVSKIINTVGS
jgi:predicted Rossmann-fold nucleotide-binding protein